MEFGPDLQRHTQFDGNRNQSMNKPLDALTSSVASNTSNLCHLYFCSQAQSACVLHLSGAFACALVVDCNGLC